MTALNRPRRQHPPPFLSLNLFQAHTFLGTIPFHSHQGQVAFPQGTAHYWAPGATGHSRCAPLESGSMDLRREIYWPSYESQTTKMVPLSANLTLP